MIRIMKYASCAILAFFVINQAYGQNNCDSCEIYVDYNLCEKNNICILEKEILKLYSQEWIDSLVVSNQRIVVSLTLDSLGNVLSIDAFKCEIMSDFNSQIFLAGLKNQIFCLFNPDPHMSFQEYKMYGQNRYKYIFIYPSSY